MLIGTSWDGNDNSFLFNSNGPVTHIAACCSLTLFDIHSYIRPQEMCNVDMWKRSLSVLRLRPVVYLWICSLSAIHVTTDFLRWVKVYLKSGRDDALILWCGAKKKVKLRCPTFTDSWQWSCLFVAPSISSSEISQKLSSCRHSCSPEAEVDWLCRPLTFPLVPPQVELFCSIFKSLGRAAMTCFWFNFFYSWYSWRTEEKYFRKIMSVLWLFLYQLDIYVFWTI